MDGDNLNAHEMIIRYMVFQQKNVRAVYINVILNKINNTKYYILDDTSLSHL